PDFETKASYAVRIRTTDQGGLTFEKAFTITINDLSDINQAPTDITLSAAAIDENVAANSTVGTLSSTDGDTSSFTYALVAGTGDTDNAAFSISGSDLKINSSPDFETKASYSVRVSTFDGTSTFEKTFTITITNVCELDNSVTLATNVLTATQTGATYQWYKCSDNSVVGTNSNTFTPTETGDYKVDITIGSCTVTSACTTVATLNTIDFETTSKVIIYPNPSQGIINVKTTTNSDFQVINLLGQVLQTFKTEADVIQTIELQNLNDSFYFIKEINNVTSKAHKIIIKKLF
ncbi:MAG: T9SS C-terminal target domain-containing protein, partial [Flavobacterium sp.]